MNFTNNQEYQLFIGCHDTAIDDELVEQKELEKMIVDFFKREEVDFTIVHNEGGYLYNNKKFVLEHSLCINIIGSDEKKMVRLAKALSMYMNQESVLLCRSPIQSLFY